MRKLPEKEDVRQSFLNTLEFLEQAFETIREKTPAQYPLDAKTGAVKLPPEIVAELKRLIGGGKQRDAIQRVTELTGARLLKAKNYVDDLSTKTLPAKDIFGRRK